MSEPKFDAPEIVTRHSFSDIDSPEEPSKTNSIQHIDDASLSVKNDTDSQSIAPTLVQAESTQRVLVDVRKDESKESILTTQREKKVSQIKITDLQEARRNRGKESYILVLFTL